MLPEEIRDAWSEAARRGDAPALGRLMSDDVVLVSPLTDQFVFSGRDEVVDLLTEVFTLISGITFTHRLHDENTVMMVVEATISGRRLQEVVLLELGDGLVTRCTFFMRPLPVLTALMRSLGPRVAAKRGQKGLALLLTVAGIVPDLVVTAGDNTVMPLAKPPSAD